MPYLDCYTLINLFPLPQTSSHSLPFSVFLHDTRYCPYFPWRREKHPSSIFSHSCLIGSGLIALFDKFFEKNPRQFLWNSATQTTTGILPDIPSFGKLATFVGPERQVSLLPSTILPLHLPGLPLPSRPKACDWQRRSGPVNKNINTTTTVPRLSLWSPKLRPMIERPVLCRSFLPRPNRPDDKPPCEEGSLKSGNWERPLAVPSASFLGIHTDSMRT